MSGWTDGPVDILHGSMDVLHGWLAVLHEWAYGLMDRWVFCRDWLIREWIRLMFCMVGWMFFMGGRVYRWIGGCFAWMDG